ncbi:MAG: YggS family pyridoxal phosphate-dependent enzyme [Balneolales bacterium]
MPVCSNIEEIKRKIALSCERSGRSPSDITLIAVSKTKPVEAIQQAVECGQRHFGENKVQELTGKMEQFENDLRWHMIGALQTNKIKYLAKRVNWIHSIGKLKQLKEVEKRAEAAGRQIKVLIQINISEEDQKSGFPAQDLREVLTYAQSLKWVNVQGLMGMASFVDDPEVVRPEFRLLRKLRDAHRDMETESLKLQHLSMGMTNDFETAIEEGSTMVRIGTAIFGGR